LGTAAVFLLLFAKDVKAERFYGCLKCDYDTTIFGAPNDRCKQVANDSWGDGIYCDEEQLLFSRMCAVSGGACYYHETTGGGGGGGGTGGGTGGGGVRNADGSCPPEYEYCY
jgi:hypothetical protein